MTSTQGQVRRDLAKAMATAAATGRVTPTRLMSPTEVDAAVRGRPDLAGRLQGWYLCTEVPREMWQPALEARSREVPYQTMVVTSPSGLRCLVVLVNADDWQHRVCIPMLGDTTARWLRSIASERLLRMSIAEADSDRAFITESVVPHEAVGELSSCDLRPPRDLSAFLEDAFSLLAWNAAVASTVPVGNTPLPKEVSLSLLLPSEVETQLEMRAAGWADRKPS